MNKKLDIGIVVLAFMIGLLAGLVLASFLV